jgi:hypothetical protein
MTTTVSVSRDFVVKGTGLPVRVSAEVHAGWGKTWVAQIETPRDDEEAANFVVHREFIDREGQAISRAGNGTYHYEITCPGLYEASSVYRSFKTWRVIFEVRADGTVERIADSESDNLRTVYRKLFPAATTKDAQISPLGENR